MKRLFFLLILLGTFLASRPGYGQKTVYLNSEKRLYTVDLQTCRENYIGEMPENMHDIALSPTGQLYAVSSSGGLYLIDKTTAKGQLIGVKKALGINALVFDKNGVLYAAGNNSLYRLNPADGTAEELGKTKNFYSGGDLTFFNDQLYLSAQGELLIKVDIGDPANSVSIGKMNGNQLWGIVTVGAVNCQGDAPKMYATGSDGVYQVDVATAKVEKVCTLSFTSVSGAASSAETSSFSKSNAGKDSTASICLGRQEPIDLKTLLNRADPFGQWKTLSGSTLVQNGAFTPEFGKEASYRFSYTVGEGLCADTALITVNIVTATVPALTDTVLCSGSSWKIDLSYLNAQLTWQDNSKSAVYTISQAGAYRVDIDKGGCKSTVQFSVAFVFDADIRTRADSISCDGKPAVLEASLPNATYRWSTNATGPSITVSQSGTYWVDVTTGKCTFRRSFNVSGGGSPLIDLLPDYELCPGKELRLEASKPGIRSYRWQDGSTESSFLVKAPGSYSLAVSNECGTRQQTIRVTAGNCQVCALFVPDAFTPNGDSVNDVLLLQTSCSLEKLQFTVFNRWGEVIFQSTDQTLGWNGTYKTRHLPNGVYTYKIAYRFTQQESERQQTGTVALLR